MELLKHNKQEPNCFAASVVMVLRHTLQEAGRDFVMSEANMESLFNYIGHRGQDILWPNCVGHLKLKGIHPQEVNDWLAEHFDYVMWVLERYPRSAPNGLEAQAKMVWDGEVANERFWKSIEKKPAILVMATHAVAWDGEEVYDPDDRRFPKSLLHNQVGEAWLFAKL